MPLVRSKQEANGFYLRGVDDWYAYMQNDKGEWFQLMTECAQEWERIPPQLQETQGGVFLVAVMMLENNVPPHPITDLESTRELSQTYGDS